MIIRKMESDVLAQWLRLRYCYRLAVPIREWK